MLGFLKETYKRVEQKQKLPLTDANFRKTVDWLSVLVSFSLCSTNDQNLQS